MKRISYKVNRKGSKRQQRTKRRKAKSLNITSLIDILTILLVFLIKNVSMEVQKASVPAGMKLPNSFVDNHALLKNGDVILIKMFPNRILYGYDNILVGTPQDLFDNKSTKNTLLALMQNEAKTIKSKDKIPAVLLQADKTLDCKYITQFMILSAGANFSNIFFSTIKADSKDGSLNN